MRAVAVFPGTKKVEVIDHPEPQITSPHEVKIQMLDVGVCGTDKEIASFQYGTPPNGEEYLVIGHESLGQVINTGAEVTRVKRGDLVVIMVRRPCDHPECLACRQGRADFCYTGDFTERGIKERHGFMTSIVVDDEQYLNVVPDSLRDVGVLTEPLTIAEKAVEQVWQIQQRLPWASASNHKALVLGAGPVGLLGAMLLRSQGFETFLYSREKADSDKARLVGSMGAAYLSSADVPVDQLAAKIGSIDLVYEAVGASQFAFDVTSQLGANGIFIFTGVPGRKAPVAIDTDLLMRDYVLKNQVIFGSVNASRSAYEAAIRDLQTFMERVPDTVRSLITSRVDIGEAPRLLAGQAGGIKNVIKLQ